jgi:glucosyl-dolichyl phosphate glucuronosyltransferase
MHITVGICTWNRANILIKTLERMLSLRIPDNVTWELLVVNNNSTDHTESVLDQYIDKLPLRKLFEPTPGKSNALNHAIREAKGDIILWTDDDVLIDSEWISAYVDAVEQWPDAVFFGGPIYPWFEGNPPEWIQRVFTRIELAFAALNLGKEPCLFTQEKLPFGANLVFRTITQRQYLYDTKLGPRPNKDMRGEETAVLKQMVSDGLKGRWVPGATVQHFIPKHRQTIKYLRGYYKGAGRIISENAKHKTCVKFLGRPRWALVLAIKNDILFLLKRFIFRPESWIENLILANTGWGYFTHPDNNK